MCIEQNVFKKQMKFILVKMNNLIKFQKIFANWFDFFPIRKNIGMIIFYRYTLY